MSKEMNGIATREDCNSIVKNVFTSDLSRCPTKSEILETGKLSIKNESNYAINQLVRYEDINVRHNIVNCLLLDGTAYRAYRTDCESNLYYELIGNSQPLDKLKFEWGETSVVSGERDSTWYDSQFNFYITLGEIWTAKYDTTENRVVEKIKNVTNDIVLTDNLNSINFNEATYRPDERVEDIDYRGVVEFHSSQKSGSAVGTITLTDPSSDISATINVDILWNCVC